jgi:hypothetical protein
MDVWEIAAAQPACQDCLRAQSSAARRVVKVQLEGVQVLVDVSSGVMRPLVPASHHRAVFLAVHGLAHPGMSRLGIKHVITSAFHPQSNGILERFHRRLKDAIRARVATADWLQHLPWILLGLQAAPRENSGVSAAELVFGTPLQLPGQFLAAAEPPPSRRQAAAEPLPSRRRASSWSS